MGEPPSTVVAADEQASTDGEPVDLERWSRLARDVLADEGVSGELTLTFVDRAEIAALNAEHLGHSGATDVLSFPLDADGESVPGVPVLLGDVVVCPAVAAEQASRHAGTLDDELALLVVHGILHVLGHDHDGHAETTSMRGRERELLQMHHWCGEAPAAFHQEHSV